MSDTCGNCTNKTCLKTGKPCKAIEHYLRRSEGIYPDGWLTQGTDAEGVKMELYRNNFPDELLSKDYQYCLDHMLSVKERQVIEHLVEGYKDREIYKLMKKVFPTLNSYYISKSRAKQKIILFLK